MANPKYSDWLDKDRLLLIQGWARDGLNDEQIAHNMGISVRTLYKWKNNPLCGQIVQALKSGKEVVDYAVENALLKEAMNGNVTAQIFWLKNRKPKEWRDRREFDASIDVVQEAKDVLVKIHDAIEDED